MTKNKKESESICRQREKWTKEGDLGVGLENQGHRLVDRWQATQVVKFVTGEAATHRHMRAAAAHGPTLEGPVVGDFFTRKKFRLRRSRWSVHALE